MTIENPQHISETPDYETALGIIERVAPSLKALIDSSMIDDRQELRIRHLAENIEIMEHDLTPQEPA